MYMVFFLVEWKVAKHPLVPIQFFATMPRIAILMGGFLQALIMTATTYFIPVYFQVVLAASPLKSGEEISKEDASAGTSTFQLLKQFGQAVSIVFGQLVIQGYIRTHAGDLLRIGVSQITISDLTTGQTIVSILETEPKSGPGIALREMFVQALKMMSVLYTAFAGVALIASFGVPMRKIPRDASNEEPADAAVEKD
ncbi:hypothetical protein BU26DRAFT_568721 [Trematosphaeria pertusa]|uniref:Uncharacterized protein n=1 Tax=Trematosphaeria pertusa TaxID=390896 RepID=A0A6A6I369_9PLEO|nr:uncharacterized protein BU26DRAFT_568721 [Trematosphaeria pertusa]KAF2244716.1 hypothetical protein BU26DRAFT_568721 [Trematosphaeria pertusa]